MIFSIMKLSTKCRYAECRDYLNVMLNVVMLRVIVLIMLNVVMLNVVAPI